MQFPGPGPADSTTSPFCKTANMHSGSTSTGSSVCSMSVELMWASEEYLRGISFLYPLTGLYKICTRSVLERLGFQKGGKDLWEWWVNANERWQSAARTVVYMDCMRTLGEPWEGARWIFHRPSFACLCSDRPPSRTLTERSIKNAGERCKVLTCQKLSATPWVLWRPPTTTNGVGHLTPLLRPPTSSNVRLRSALFSWTLDELCPEHSSETGRLTRIFAASLKSQGHRRHRNIKCELNQALVIINLYVKINVHSITRNKWWTDWWTDAHLP